MKITLKAFAIFGLCVLSIEANASLRRRVNTMERRMNTLEMRVITDDDTTNNMFDSLQQDVGTLNSSLINLKDQVCLKNEIARDNEETEKTPTHRTGTTSFQSNSNILVSLGIANEKTWLREQVHTLSLEIANEKKWLREQEQTLSLEIANETKWLREEVQTLSLEIANETKWLREEVQAFKHEQRDSVDSGITEFKNSLKGHEESIGIKLNAQAAVIGTVQEDLRKMNNSVIDQAAGIRTKVQEDLRKMNNSVIDQAAGIRTKVQEEVRKMNNSVIDLEQNLENNISAVTSEVSVNSHTIQSLEEEIRRNTEIIKEQKLVMDNLIENLVSHNIIKVCSDGWTYYDSFCYLFVKDIKTYDDARETCSSLGASVADIQSKQEGDFIVKFSEDGGQIWGGWPYIWIGITDEVTENVWISDRTGARASYTNWRTGQPDGGTRQQCVVIGNEQPYDQWNDYPCHYKHRFVCKSLAKLIST